MNVFAMSKENLEAGINQAKAQGIDGNAYGQALMWNLLQYYHWMGRTEADIKSEFQYAIDNLEDDGDFHVSRN